MSRIFLFRGKPKNSGDWVEGVPIQHSDGDWQIQGGYSNAGYLVTVASETICQYIGLSDKNSKRIFEGDIVKHYNDSDDDTRYVLGYIEWNHDNCQFMLHRDDQVICNISHKCIYEVIGNIFDDPELMEYFHMAVMDTANKISRNDYYQMIREAIRENREIPDGHEILPLDLSDYKLSKKAEMFVNVHFREETTDKNGNYMLKGHWPFDISHYFTKQCGFLLKQIDGYSSYAFSDEQMAVFTYCEGDICLTLFTDREKYEREKADTIKYYQEDY